MAQILRLTDYIEARVPDAVSAISELSDAADAFSKSIDRYAECLRAQTNPLDQTYMIEAWQMIRDCLCKLDATVKSAPHP